MTTKVIGKINLPNTTRNTRFDEAVMWMTENISGTTTEMKKQLVENFDLSENAAHAALKKAFEWNNEAYGEIYNFFSHDFFIAQNAAVNLIQMGGCTTQILQKIIQMLPLKPVWEGKEIVDEVENWETAQRILKETLARENTTERDVNFTFIVGHIMVNCHKSARFNKMLEAAKASAAEQNLRMSEKALEAAVHKAREQMGIDSPQNAPAVKPEKIKVRTVEVRKNLTKKERKAERRKRDAAQLKKMQEAGII